MRFKWQKHFYAKVIFFLFSVVYSAESNITIGLTEGTKGEIVTESNIDSIYILTTSAMDSTVNTDYNSAYHFWDPNFLLIDLTNTTETQLTLRLSNFTAGNTPYIYLYGDYIDDSSTHETFKFLTVSNASNIDGTLGKFSISNKADTVDLTLNLASQCVVGAPLVDSGSCTSNKPNVSGFRLRVVESASSSRSGVTEDEIKFGTTFRIYPQFSFPKLETTANCPTNESLNTKVFYPGDQSIVLQKQNFVPEKASLLKGSPVTSSYTLFKAWSDNSIHNASEAGNVYEELGPSSDGRINGFENSTNSSPILYSAIVGVRDHAGAKTYCHTGSGTSGTLVTYTGVFSSEISGFLKESNCFIATATYENSRHPVVILFRNFRDRFLNSFLMGRTLVKIYYSNSPYFANLLIKNPSFRPLIKMIFQPITIFVYLFLNQKIFWTCVFLTFFIFIRRYSSRLKNSIFLLLCFFFIQHQSRAADGSESQKGIQPYIDSLISTLPPKSEDLDSYSQKLKNKLPPDENNDSYTARLKTKLNESSGNNSRDDSQNYSQRLKEKLPPLKDNDGSISRFNSHQELKGNRGDSYLRSAFNIKVATHMSRNYETSDGDAAQYEKVYGKHWIPDFTMTYEMRPFHQSAVADGFGLLGRFGFSGAKGYGKFGYISGFGETSDVIVRLINLPLTLGVSYSVMLTSIIKPFIQLGGGALGFYETRSDNVKPKRGYSPVNTLNLGVHIGLNFLSEKSSWDAYDSHLVKQTSLTFEYSRLSTFGKGIANATISGVNAGILFEF